jgi:hypothetical protein
MAARVFLGLAAHGILAAQTPTSVRAAARAPLDRDREIALARSAAPASISARARVLVFTDTGYVVGDAGSSEVTCVVNRSWRDSIEPHCYDPEGARTVMPIELRRGLLRHRGVSERDIEHELADGIFAGHYHLPARPAVSYMMSAAQVLYNDEGQRVGAWRPHLMIYYPYLTEAAVGMGTMPDMTVGMVSEAGRAEANLTIIMPHFVELAATAKR